MKTSLLKTVSCVFPFIAAALMFLPSSLKAQQFTDPEKNPLTINFVKEEDGYFIFRVSVLTEPGSKPVLKIYGNREELLYTEYPGEGYYCRNYKFAAEELETLSFNISFGKKSSTKSYAVKTSTQTVYDLREIKPKK